MLGNRNKQNAASDNAALSSELNTIAKGTVITGEVVSEGILRIDGRINGTVRTKSKIAVGKTGVIEGDLYCDEADVEGKVIGSVNVDKQLTIRTHGNVSGDISTGTIVVEAGALFNGSCSMGNQAQMHGEKTLKQKAS
ncbi:MAG: cytoskeletal protein CcmA (bactofilin family) [Limisphaerales bacterium]|jgi:cytoskeletal protein CcmA (bactofilin family)